MDNGVSNGGGSFKVMNGPDAAEVTNVYKTGVGEVGDVIRIAVRSMPHSDR